MGKNYGSTWDMHIPWTEATTATESIAILDFPDDGDEDDLMERGLSLADLSAWGRSMEGGDTSHMLDD